MIVRHRFDTQVHRHGHLDAIAILPLARQREIAARAGHSVDRLAVDFNGRVRGPLGNAQTDRRLDRLRRLYGQHRGRRLGKFRVLPDANSLLRPIQFRSDEQINVQACVVVPIDGIVELGIFLDARTGAAPERLIFSVERFPRARRERQIILSRAGFGMNRTKPHVQQRSFVVIEIARIGGPLIKMPRELQHVVAAAAFLRRRGALQFLGHLARLGQPAFAVAGAAGHIRSRAHHIGPEEIGDIVEAHVARNFVAAGRADHLRDMRVDVQPAQFIASQAERIEESLLGIAIASFGPTVVIRGPGKIVEHLIHPAVFRVEDALHVLFGFGRGPLIGPARHAL